MLFSAESLSSLRMLYGMNYKVVIIQTGDDRPLSERSGNRSLAKNNLTFLLT